MTFEEVEKAIGSIIEWQERANKMTSDLLQTTRQAANNAQSALQTSDKLLVSTNRLLNIAERHEERLARVESFEDRLTRIEGIVERNSEAIGRLERVLEDYIRSIRNGKGGAN